MNIQKFIKDIFYCSYYKRNHRHFVEKKQITIRDVNNLRTFLYHIIL